MLNDDIWHDIWVEACCSIWTMVESIVILSLLFQVTWDKIKVPSLWSKDANFFVLGVLFLLAFITRKLLEREFCCNMYKFIIQKCNLHIFNGNCTHISVHVHKATIAIKHESHRYWKLNFYWLTPEPETLGWHHTLAGHRQKLPLQPTRAWTETITRVHRNNKSRIISTAMTQWYLVFATATA